MFFGTGILSSGFSSNQNEISRNFLDILLLELELELLLELLLA